MKDKKTAHDLVFFGFFWFFLLFFLQGGESEPTLNEPKKRLRGEKMVQTQKHD